MQSFIKKLNNKYVIAVFGMAMLVSAFTAGAVPAFSASCSGTVPTAPVFNYWPLTYDSSATCMDLPLIDARDLSAPAASRDNRYSASQGEHDAGISASVGDQVRVSIYFHNGATDEASYRDQTTAHNVQVGSTFSTAATTVHTVKGSLSADNAATVTSESNHQGGDITINTPSATTLQYVPGSTQMCIQYAAAEQRGADMSQTCGTDASGQPKILINLPDGIANGTVGIGDLESCFPYSGEVVYSVTVVAAAPSNGALSITKQVEDVTTGTSFASSVTANQGDTVEYQVVVKNTSDVTVKNVVVTDPGTNGTQFTNGNTETSSIGDLSAGQSQTVDYNATVTASSGSYTNTATAKASNASSVHASAVVKVNHVVTPTNGTLSITKQVEDVTTNSGFSSSVTANQNDTVEYQVVVTNTGSITLNNVVVTDPGTSGTQFTNGNTESTNIGTLTAGQSQTVDYNARVTAYSGSYTNTATASASNAPSESASAVVNVNQIVTPSNGQLFITKLVRDLTYSNSNGFSSSTSAFSGDQVQYQIVVTNESNITLNNVIVSDSLPYGDTYISGTVDNGTYANNGIQSLGSMYAGQSHTITINAIVNGASGQQIQNTATASASNAPTVSASALVYIGGGVTTTSTSFTYSKSAFNDTKNVDATTVPADKDDYITYTLTATNTGSTLASNFVFTDDLTNVLNYASMVQLNGGTLSGNTITWPSVTIAPNTSVKETFEVRVNYNLPTSYNNLQLVNTYGNTVTIQINNPQVITPIITAPTTGPAGEAAFALGFAGLLTLAFHFIRKAILARKSA